MATNRCLDMVVHKHRDGSIGLLVTAYGALETARSAYEKGRWREAEAACREMLRVQPNCVDALHLLGNVLLRTGQAALASAFLRKAIRLQPGTSNLHTSLGMSLLAVGRFSDGETHVRTALELKPSSATAHRVLAIARRAQGDLEGAADQFRRVLELQPADVSAHLELAATLRDLGRRAEALATCNLALALDPGQADAYVALGNLFLDKALAEEGAAAFRRALALNPNLPIAHSNLLFALHYLPSYTRSALRCEAETWASRHSVSTLEATIRRNVPDPARRLRVGYVSADFVRHPVGYFIEAVLKAQDRSQVEVFCYSNAWRTDSLTQRLHAAAEHWRTIAWQSDFDVASMIRSDEIDILVDLSGHTAGHRLQLFGLKPAPIQATWLGYFGTTGLSAIDYILVDEVICSQSDEDQFVETPVRLPDSYLCYAPPEAVPVRSSPAARLGFATFGCFNKLVKVTPAVVAVWAEILRRIPAACLVLKDAALEDLDVRTRCQAQFVSEGVDANRLDLLGRSDHLAYLDAYNQVDIALDPFPFNGGTTTAEALWMGVPVVTLRGDHFVSRLGASLLTGLGVRELIADSREEYVEIATRLANDVPRLMELRAGLRARMLTSPLCDGPGYTRGLEAAYRRMWQAWCAAQTGGITHR